jgi:hypothetical protein
MSTCTYNDNMIIGQGPSWSWSYGVWIYNYLCNQCLSPLMLWVRISMRAGCITLCNKVCRWLATGRWFSPSTPVSFTNKTDRHDIAEILLKVALKTIKQTNKQMYSPQCQIIKCNIYIPSRFVSWKIRPVYKTSFHKTIN